MGELPRPKGARLPVSSAVASTREILFWSYTPSRGFAHRTGGTHSRSISYYPGRLPDPQGVYILVLVFLPPLNTDLVQRGLGQSPRNWRCLAFYNGEFAHLGYISSTPLSLDRIVTREEAKAQGTRYILHLKGRGLPAPCFR